MANKLLVFLGLADRDDVEDHRKRRNDYMKKIQRLVVEDGVQNRPAPAAPVIPDAEPKKEETTKTAEQTAASNAPTAADVKTTQTEKPQHVKPEKRAPRHSAAAAKDDKSFKNRFFGGNSHKETAPKLVLVRKKVTEMVEDIEDAMMNGQTVLVDFENEDTQTAKATVSKIVNFVRVHNGAFYAVTKTSMLVSMDKNAIIEWVPEETEEK